MPSTATYITLLPPLLPPLNYMKIRMIDSKVAVVTVKSIFYLVKSYWVKELLGYSVDKWIGCSNGIRIVCSNVIRIGHSVVRWIGHSVVK